MKHFFIIPFIIFTLLGCNFFSAELPWATGYFTEIPGDIGTITEVYDNGDSILKLSWNSVPRAQLYEINYVIQGITFTVNTPSTQTSYSFELDNLYNKGAVFDEVMSYTIRALNNTGSGQVSSTGSIQPMGEGTETNPYKIPNKAAFLAINGRSNYTDNFDLVTNIDLGNISDSDIYDLYGIFDGLGHDISYILTSSTNYGGLFRTLNGQSGNEGVIKNLNVESNYSITSTTTNLYYGILVGHSLSYTNISNCNVTGTITTSNSALQSGVGGVAGRCYGTIESTTAVGISISGDSLSSIGGIAGVSRGVINKCFSSGVITGRTYLGGIVGLMEMGSPEIHESSSSISITGGSNNLGGFGGAVGRIQDGTVKNCYSTGNLSSSTTTNPLYSVGGFFGSVSESSGTINIENCFSSGNLSLSSTNAGFSQHGGFVGYFYSGFISNCIAFAQSFTMSGTYTETGPFVGELGSTAVESSIYRYNSTTINGSFTNTTATTLTATQFSNSGSAVYSVWDFSNTWQMTSNGPILRNLPGAVIQDPILWD